MPVISGDLRIDALIAGANIRWGTPGGATPVVTYSFMKTPARTDSYGFSLFTSEQITAAQTILAMYSREFKIDFLEVTEFISKDAEVGMIRFGNNYQGNLSAGYAYLPDPTSGSIAGDIYLNNADTEQLNSVEPGSYAWSTMVHEIGHALGLKHPGDYNSTGAVVEGPFLSKEKDTTIFSVMSYNAHPNELERIDIASYDRLAMGYLYGTREVNTGDTVHKLTDAYGLVQTNLLDSNGIDTIDASAISSDIKLFLVSDIASSVGKLINGSTSQLNLTLAFDAQIENAIGGQGNDFISGNSANNQLQGGSGNDVLDTSIGFDILTGGAGSDVFSLNGAGQFTLTDFTSGQDSINFNLAQYGIRNLAELLPYITGITQEKENAVVHFVNDIAAITFIGMQTTQITADLVSFNTYHNGIMS